MQLLPKAVHLTDALLAGDAILGGVGRGLTDRHGDGEADQQEGEHLDQVQVTDEAKVMNVALYRAHFLYCIKLSEWEWVYWIQSRVHTCMCTVPRKVDFFCLSCLAFLYSLIFHSKFKQPSV